MLLCHSYPATGPVEHLAVAMDTTTGMTARREALIERLLERTHDVLVVGGGINGAISALALGSCGLRVALIESSDYGSGVSQESSNLIWGGFKYLQTREIGLVAGLCASRNRLARAFPSQVHETRFVGVLGSTSPYSSVFATLGAHVYWALGRFATQRPGLMTTRSLAVCEPAVELSGVRGAVQYSDYRLMDNDSRFVLQLVLDAVRSGVTAVSRVQLEAAERAGAEWRTEVLDRLTGNRHCVSARVLVNAAGTNAAKIAKLCDIALTHSLRFSKGAHIVVPQVTESGRVLAFFDDDQRLFYVIPMGHRSLIGTTDTRTDHAEVAVTDEDRNFLLDQANQHLRLARPLEAGDVIAEQCGVRALVTEPAEPTEHIEPTEPANDERRDWLDLSRRHAVETDTDKGMVSILGGKLSDCLNVGEEVAEAVRACGVKTALPQSRWYGEPPEPLRSRFLTTAQRVGLDRSTSERLWRRHGRRASEVAELVGESADLGLPLSDLINYSAAEVEVMARHEQIITMEDFLRRRTMLALLEPAESLCADPATDQLARLLFDR